ncbi:MAG TPA: hypothetical protein VFA31_08090 [Candidatus Polarisedimenticolia bacterium]|nr:hypothetical protein [Candidatus Polarisedimenticolia bacterium]
MIFDLEGAAAPRATPPRLGVVLSVASAAIATAALLMTAALPHAAAPRFVETRPSVLEQAFAKQKPPTTLDLALPSDVAVEVLPQRVDGIYGPARPAPTLRSFRMRGSSAIVIVAMLPGAPAIVAPPDLSTDALSVRGWYAANYSVEATSLSAVRWTENGMTYEIASRTLSVADLVRLAEQVR